MKAAALRHLLLDCARQAAATAGEDGRLLLQGIAQSLTVARDGTWFELRWKDARGEHTLDVPLTAFSFYVTGDNPAAVARRRGVLDLRAANWASASEVLGRMVAVSGGTLSQGPETYRFVPPTARRVDAYFPLSSTGVTVASAATAAWVGGPLAGVGAFFATALALVVFRLGAASAGQKEPALLEEAIVACSVAATPLAGQPTPLALVLLAAAAPCVAEISKGSPWSWLVAGLAGAPAFALGAPGVAALVVLLLARFASSWMMPDRFSWTGACLYALGGLAGLLLPQQWLALSGETPGMLVLVPGILFACSFASWWFHGVHQRVYPWYAQLAMAVAACAAIGRPGWVALAGTAGLGLVLGARVIRNFRQSRRAPRETI